MPYLGDCKLCRSPYAPALNKLIIDNKNEAECAKIMEVFDMTWTRKTFYKHRDHVTSPLVNPTKYARENPVVLPQSNKETLQTIRDLGMERVLSNPEAITIDHTLKAAAELSKLENDKKQQVILLMGQAAAGRDEIEGDWDEYPLLEGGEELDG